MKHLLTFISLILTALSCTLHAHDIVPGAKQTSPILLTNGTIHTISGDTIENGQLLFENGAISAIDQKINPPEGTEVLDLEGKHVYPGMISAISVAGLVEINAVPATIDLGELGAFNPNIKAEVAFNPDSELIPVTRANGVLVANITPQTRGNGLIAGTSALVHLDGWTIEDMTVQAPTAMHISWPRDPRNPDFSVDPPRNYNPKRAEENYSQQVEKLDDMFEDARAFWKAKDSNPDSLSVDLRWEAMEPVLKKELPVYVFANTARQIRDTIHWANQQDLKLVILGGQDAWRVADLIKEHDVPIILVQVNRTPTRRWESYDTSYRNPALLHEAGIRFAISYRPSAANERNLPYEAGKAVAFGLPKEEALKAITLYPAEIMGVGDRLGSLEVGKEATLIVTTGNPLDVRSNVEMAFIQGRFVQLSSRHTQLYEKYQERYRQQ